MWGVHVKMRRLCCIQVLMVEPVCAADSVELHLSQVFVGRHVARTVLLLLQSGTVQLLIYSCKAAVCIRLQR
jgi:hypothetical protein